MDDATGLTAADFARASETARQQSLHHLEMAEMALRRADRKTCADLLVTVRQFVRDDDDRDAIDDAADAFERAAGPVLDEMRNEAAYLRDLARSRDYD